MTASIKQAAPGSLSPPHGEAALAWRAEREKAERGVVLAWFVKSARRGE